MAMTTKDARQYDKITQSTLKKIKKFRKMEKLIESLTNQKKVLGNELIEEVLSDKSVNINEYLNIGKYFIGVAQSSPSFATIKSELEAELKKRGVDIEKMKKYGKLPDATFKVVDREEK